MTIRFENSVAMSTVDPSSEEGATVPAAPVPDCRSRKAPERSVCRYEFPVCAASPSGFGNVAIGMMKSGATVQQVVAAIAQSPEFQAEGADGPAAFVTAMYDNALDRAPPPEGLANWVSQIAAGLPLSDVVIAFADTVQRARR